METFGEGSAEQLCAHCAACLVLMSALQLLVRGCDYGILQCSMAMLAGVLKELNVITGMSNIPNTFDIWYICIALPISEIQNRH